MKNASNDRSSTANQDERPGGVAELDMVFSLFSTEERIDVVLTLHVHSGSWPAGVAGGYFEPWSVNYRILLMLTIQRAMEYLNGAPMPEYMTVRKGMASLEAAKGLGRMYFPSRRSLEWSAQPLGLRTGKDVAWLELNTAAGAEDTARWQLLDAKTWRKFWRALDEQYNLSHAFPSRTN